MHVEIDRIREGDDTAAIEERRAAGAARRPRVRRGLGEDARPGARDRRRARAPTRRRWTPRRSARAASCSSGWPPTTSPSSATASTSSSATARTSCSAPCPAPASASCAPTRTCRRRSASCRRWSRPRRARRRCWCWPRPTRARPCTARRTSTTSASRSSTNGEVVGERRFLGLFSSAAYTESLTRIPLLREKAAAVLKRIGFDPRSHAGKALMDTLETYPRDELFHTPVDELAPMAEAAMHARERRQVRMFIRRDTYGRYVSVLVYLPRDRYNTNVRERFSHILKERLGGESVEFNVSVNESTTARVHFVVHPPKGGTIAEVDTDDLERRLTDASRSWRDDFTSAVIAEYGEEVGARLGRRYVDSFPEAYKEDFAAAHRLGRPRPARGARRARRGIDLSLYEQMDAGRGEARLKVFRIGPPLSLSEILPMLSLDGRRGRRRAALRARGPGPPDVHLRVRAALRPGRCRRTPASCSRTRCARCGTATTRSTASTRWSSAAGLTWRQATVLRAYAKYMKQGNSPVRPRLHRGRAAQQRRHHPAAGPALRGAVRPGHNGLAADAEARTARVEAIEEPDQPRARRRGQPRPRPDPALLPDPHQARPCAPTTSSRSTSTTVAAVRSYMSFKLEPSAIPDLPEPRPRFEIFVYSPRVEGVHLRFGAVARGGLRWSDRRDDFRTEVLGLVKAQMVKNTVIVPVGAKGGFFCKQLPDPSRPRRVDGRGHRLLQDLHLRAARHHRQPRRRRDRAAARRRAPRRRRLLPGGRRRQGHRDVLRHRQRGRARTTASGSATRSPAAARSATTTRRWASPPAAPGSRCSGTSASAASTARPRTSPRSASATCPATCSATACSAPSTPGWWRRSTTATSSSTRRRTRRRRTPSGAALRPAALELAGLRQGR